MHASRQLQALFSHTHLFLLFLSRSPGFTHYSCILYNIYIANTSPHSVEDGGVFSASCPGFTYYSCIIYIYKYIANTSPHSVEEEGVFR